MFAEKGFDYDGLVGLEAALHHRPQRPLGGAAFRQDGKGSKGQGRRAIKIARHQETTGRKRGQGSLIRLAEAKIGREGFGEALCRHLVGRPIGINCRCERQPFTGQFRANA